MSAEEIVQAQLDAYNARDLARFLTCFDADAEVYEHPATLLAKGLAQIGERYATTFSDPKLHAVVLKRIVMDHRVIDHERVTRTFPEGVGTRDAVAIYEVRNGKIFKEWLLLGPRTHGAGQGKTKSIKSRRGKT